MGDLLAGEGEITGLESEDFSFDAGCSSIRLLPERHAVQDPRAKRPYGAEREVAEDELAVQKADWREVKFLQTDSFVSDS